MRWLRPNLPELSALLAIGAVAVLLLAFGYIAEEVMESDSLAFDRTVLLWFRNPADLADPIGPAWVEEAARDVTSLGSFSILGLLVAAASTFLIIAQKRSAALWLLGSSIGGTFLSTLLKIAFERPRPDIVAP